MNDGRGRAHQAGVLEARNSEASDPVVACTVDGMLSYVLESFLPIRISNSDTSTAENRQLASYICVKLTCSL